MRSNLNTTDRIVRLVLAAIVAILYFRGTIAGTLGIVLLVAAGIIGLTAIVNFCPIYQILGISTRKP